LCGRVPGRDGSVCGENGEGIVGTPFTVPQNIDDPPYLILPPRVEPTTAREGCARTGIIVMPITLTASFATRREADMTIERLVQEQGIERTDIFVVAVGDDNTVGEEVAGADAVAAEPSREARDDAALNGQVTVSVDVEDDDRADEIRGAFAEFDATDVTID
jgi:hypothetical protein